ncbi:MAG TPA: hypothetical protein P5123_04655 [Spirochaetota bacterium]|nr:hypothetical protein [Spirochaetota bacterium]
MNINEFLKDKTVKIIFFRQIAYYREWVNALGVLNFNNSLVSYGDYKKLTIRLIYKPASITEFLSSPFDSLKNGGKIVIELFGFKLSGDFLDKNKFSKKGNITSITVNTHRATVTIKGRPYSEGDEEFKTIEQIITDLSRFNVSQPDR